MKKMGRPTKAEMALKAKEKAELEMIRRTGGRLKKATKVFDPSENNVRKRRNNVQLAKDESTNSKVKEDNKVESDQSYLKLRALDELLSEDQNVESDLNKTDDFVNEESSAILEENTKSKDSDTEFTPNVKKVQKIRHRRKRLMRRNTISYKNSPKEADPEFTPNGIHKNLKQRKQKIQTLADDTIQLIKLPENASNQAQSTFTEEPVAPKPQRGRPCKRSKTEQISVCSICLRSKLMDLITCVDCNTKAHKDCLKTNFNNKSLELKWHCDNCKICEICYETYETGKIITCSMCVKSYHTVCHIPTIIDNSPNFDQANWVCTRCANKIASSSKIAPITIIPNNDTSKAKTPLANTVVHNSSDVLKQENDKSVVPGFDHNKLIINNVGQKNLSTSVEQYEPSAIKIESELNVPITEVEKPQKDLNAIGDIDAEDIPDVSKWSCEKLSQFIAEIFPNEAHVFMDQEIDGAALLLLTRTFVLTRLGLKLGPALRLYNFIITLQTRKHDEFATWFY